jgi:protein tyrosine/serine phosphatase
VIRFNDGTKKVMKTKSSVKSFVFLSIPLLMGAGLYRTSTFRPAMNFHEVDAGRLYRSAQLTGEEFEEVVHRYGIKSVINLRGSQPGEQWFDTEKATLEKLGIQLENVAFTTEHVPPRTQLIKYLDALEKLPRPILIHCRAGADRTGEASAIYALEYMHQPLEKALEQLSFRYLHVEVFQPAKRFFINRYAGHQWARTAYDPCSPEFIGHASKWDCPVKPEAGSPGIATREKLEPSRSL